MSNIKTIRADAVPSLLESSDVMILDCRDVPDYQAGHMDGAMHAHDALVESMVRKGDKARTVLIYCYSGHRSEHLTEFLTQFGYNNAYNLLGGYAEWQTWQAKQAC